MAATLAQSFALVLRLWRAEGARSLLDRWLDRRLDARRAARFRVLPGATPGTGSQTLWVLPFALHRRRGGAAIQLLVRLEELARDRPVALLHRLPDRLRCEVWGHGAGSPLAREWPVPAPEAWAAIVIEAARWARAERVHFESLVDLAADLPLAVRAGGYACGLSAHDFALFCPRPHLIEEPAGRFCGFSADPGRCARCLEASWPLPAGFQERRRAIMAEAIAAADRLEFPSEYMRREHQTLFPGIDPARSCVVPPRSLAGPLASPARSVLRPPQRIAFAGAVHRHKGAVEFEQLVRQLEGLRPGAFEWHVFGGGDTQLLARLRALPRTRVHGYYRAGALPARLRAAKIDLVVLPSIWPEAHCLVLDECAAAGVPALAFDLGALGERIRAGGLGAVIDPRAGAAGLAAHIAALG